MGADCRDSRQQGAVDGQRRHRIEGDRCQQVTARLRRGRGDNLEVAEEARKIKTGEVPGGELGGTVKPGQEKPENDQRPAGKGKVSGSRGDGTAAADVTYTGGALLMRSQLVPDRQRSSMKTTKCMPKPSSRDVVANPTD